MLMLTMISKLQSMATRNSCPGFGGGGGGGEKSKTSEMMAAINGTGCLAVSRLFYSALSAELLIYVSRCCPSKSPIRWCIKS